jgi:hypothetical protein
MADVGIMSQRFLVLISLDQSGNRSTAVGTPASKDQVIVLDSARFNKDVDRLTAGTAPYTAKQLRLHQCGYPVPALECWCCEEVAVWNLHDHLKMYNAADQARLFAVTCIRLVCLFLLPEH